MRIAIDCRLWNEGGVGRYIRNLVGNLANLDKENEYTLILFKGLENSKFKCQITNKIPSFANLSYRQAGVSANRPSRSASRQNSNIKFQNSNCRWHSLAEQTNFYRELMEGDYDLVHFPYFSHPILYNRPFVITIHDLTILKFATGKATTKNPLIYSLKRIGYQKVLAHGIYKAKKILVPSEFVKKDILANFKVPLEKIIVTYEGVGEELEKIQNSNGQLLTTNYSPLTTDPFFIYVGNFYPHKNVEFLIKAWSKLDSQLVLAGPNDYFTERIRLLIKKLNLSDRVKFVFNPTDEQLAELYQQAKGLILPSLFEGFGLPIVEAAYFNCPLLLSDIPVFQEVAPEGALFFDPKNEKNFLDQLSKLSHISTFQSANKETYFSKFSFLKMAQKTLETYKQK